MPSLSREEAARNEGVRLRSNMTAWSEKILASISPFSSFEDATTPQPA